MPSCDCMTVKNYDGEWRCMQCYRLFVPAEHGPDINALIKKDYTPDEAQDNPRK